MTKGNRKIYIYFVAVLAMLFWGMSFVWTSIVFKYYSPVTTVFLRLLISTALMFPGLKLFRKIEKIKKGDLKLFLISSLLNPFLYFVGESYGLKYSSPTISAAFISLIPLIIPVVAFFTIKEKLPKLSIAGLIISFGGIMMMLINKDMSLNATPAGIAFLSLAVLTAVWYSILLKKLTTRHSSFFIIAVQNLIGAIYFLPVFLIFELHDFIEVRPNFELAGSLLSLAVLCSSLAFVFFAMSTKEIGVSKTGMLTNLIPVFTAVFSYIILDEYFSVNKIAGMVIVIIGLFISQIKKTEQVIQYTGT
jgi:drug/metabolite transporter (DMT)-like permease